MARVLLVKLGAIGDAMMLLPAAMALTQRRDEVEWLCGRQIAPLLELYPGIRTIVADERALLRGEAAARMRAVVEVWRRLAGRRYDVIATMYYDRRYELLTRTARAQRRLRLSGEDRQGRILPGRHHADEYARLLLGLVDEVRPEVMAPVVPDRMPVSPVPRKSGVARVVLVPGGAHNLLREDALRRWPAESFAAVARGLLGAGVEVILSGGPGDGWASAAFAGLPVLDCIGRHSLPETMGLFDTSDAVVTPDSGPLHLAGATRASVVAIFGPTSPHSFLPQRPGVVALWGGEGFGCRPCYDGREYAPCPENACVRQVTPGMVMGAVMTALAERREGVLRAARIEVPPSTMGGTQTRPVAALLQEGRHG